MIDRVTHKTADRRAILRTLAATGALSTLNGAAFGAAQAESPEHEALQPEPERTPKHPIRFGICGMSHDHIYGMIDAIKRGGGELIAAWGAEPDKLARFAKRYPQVKMVMQPDEILDDASLALVLSSQIASERAGIGVRAMRRGKDFLADKPGVTTLEDLRRIREAIAATGRIYGIMYSERLEVAAAVHAGELIKQGAIGKVIQTINIAPHQIDQGAAGGDAGGREPRPAWFWNERQYGGILCDIGSHQIDQFLFYTGSTSAEVIAAQVANVRHPNRPDFQDFGDMMLRGDQGFGYVRLDWFTPDGLGTWGDGRLFILGTEGYMEVRKYTNIAVSKQGNNLYVVDAKRARYIDCSRGPLPFGPQFVADLVERTQRAQNQAQCLLAAELAIRAQQNATRVSLKL